MNVHADPATFDFTSRLREHGRKTLLRFIVCGSVDHGKSTLIGRLLYESKQLFEDQLDALAVDSRRFGTQQDEFDFSLLLDGLAAEREQKITIDVAYRFFETAKRKFIVIDAPGHEQYTSNMATGASVADLALVLVSAEDGVTKQTKRHALLLSMLGIRKIVLVVNKMDRANWAEKTFASIEGQFRQLAAGLGIEDVTSIPLAAKSGDNVVERSGQMPWYHGSTLLECLEDAAPQGAPRRQPLRLPIQWVNRPNPEFRGYSGLIASGELRTGMQVKILPSGRVTRIARITTFDGDLEVATAGRSITVTFTDDLDASRGDMIVGLEQAPRTTDRVAARVFWMGNEPVKPERNYLLKLATKTVTASIETDLKVFDLDTQQSIAADTIGQNEIGFGTLKFDRLIPVDRYADCKDTGGFVLIDPESYDTVGMGCVENVFPIEHASSPRAVDGAAKSGPARWSKTDAPSLTKAVSWQVIGSLVTFVVAFVVTGSAKVAGSVAIAEILTKILIYYGHERVWSWIPWGKRSLG
jgi:sulfate adenylyltransferase large subunit